MSKQIRPPVITIMGHVDHGKTTLLDYIRKTNVQAREAGGITQHIGAYQIDFKSQKLTFIDTPGHAAFRAMRQRGAQITDIVVLVVAVNDGVKPQTIESIRFIKESNVSLIVAINKTDLKDVYPDMVKGQLAEHDVKVQGMGGDIDAIEISAKTGKGVDKLLETITVMSELMDLKADPEAPLEAVVIESSKDHRRGPVASVIVQQGTLHPRQDLVTEDGEVEGRARLLADENGKQLKEVKPGCPAEIVGLKEVPAVGAIIHDANAEYGVNEDQEQIDDIQSDQENLTEETDPFAEVDFDSLFEEKEKLKLVIKADVEGTLEAILENLDDESVELVSFGVGQVTERDIELASTTGSLILAFHTKVPKNIANLAKQAGVKIKSYDIIYKLIEDLQKQMLKLLEPTIDEVVTGEIEIKQIFEMKGNRIAGCRVKTGELKKADKLHLKRDGKIIADPVIATMLHGKDEVDNVKTKGECGITFKTKKLDFQVGDTLVAYYEKED